MNKQHNYEDDNQKSLIEDLTVNPDQTEAIKGGPIVVKEIVIKATV